MLCLVHWLLIQFLFIKEKRRRMSPAEPGAWRANQGGVWDLTEWFEWGHGHILAIRRREGCFLCWHCVCVRGDIKRWWETSSNHTKNNVFLTAGLCQLLPVGSAGTCRIFEVCRRADERVILRIRRGFTREQPSSSKRVQVHRKEASTGRWLWLEI